MPNSPKEDTKQKRPLWKRFVIANVKMYAISLGVFCTLVTAHVAGLALYHASVINPDIRTWPDILMNLKGLVRKAAFLVHPDRGGSEEAMHKLQEAKMFFQNLFEMFKTNKIDHFSNNTLSYIEQRRLTYTMIGQLASWGWLTGPFLWRMMKKAVGFVKSLKGASSFKNKLEDIKTNLTKSELEHVLTSAGVSTPNANTSKQDLLEVAIESDLLKKLSLANDSKDNSIRSSGGGGTVASDRPPEWMLTMLQKAMDAK